MEIFHILTLLSVQFNLVFVKTRPLLSPNKITLANKEYPSHTPVVVDRRTHIVGFINVADTASRGDDSSRCKKTFNVGNTANKNIQLTRYCGD